MAEVNGPSSYKAGYVPPDYTVGTDALQKLGQMLQNQGKLNVEKKTQLAEFLQKGIKPDASGFNEAGQTLQDAKVGEANTTIQANDPNSDLSKGVTKGYNKVIPGIAEPGLSAEATSKFLANPMDADAKKVTAAAMLANHQNNFNTKDLQSSQKQYSTSSVKDTDAENQATTLQNFIKMALTDNGAARNNIPTLAASLASHGQRLHTSSINANSKPADVETMLRNYADSAASGSIDPKYAQDLNDVAQQLKQSGQSSRRQKAMLISQQYANRSGQPMETAYQQVTGEQYPQPQVTNENSPLPPAMGTPQQPPPPASAPGKVTSGIMNALRSLNPFVSGQQAPQTAAPTDFRNDPGFQAWKKSQGR